MNTYFIYYCIPLSRIVKEKKSNFSYSDSFTFKESSFYICKMFLMHSSYNDILNSVFISAYKEIFSQCPLNII